MLVWVETAEQFALNRIGVLMELVKALPPIVWERDNAVWIG